MKNAKVTTSKNSGHFEVIVNGVLVLVDRKEYEAIEKTLSTKGEENDR